MSYPTETEIETHHDTIPNFAVNDDIRSVASGNWEDNSTWDLGRPPAAGEIIGIDSAHTVTYNSNSATEYEAVGVAGTLQFSTSANTKLCVQHLLIYGPPLGVTGHLKVGTALAPVESGVTAEIVINNTAIDTGTAGAFGTDPAQYGNGILCWGRLQMHGSAKTEWIQLGAEPEASDTTLTLSDTVSGWSAGDELVLPDTRQPSDGAGTIFGNGGHRWESPVIDSVDGTTVNLTAGLNYDHFGGEHGFGADATTPENFYPHVGNLTRNVIIRSESGTGVRGHCLFTNRANVDIRYTRFKELGRTTNGNLSSYFTTSGGFFGVSNTSPIAVNVSSSTFSGSGQWNTGDTITIAGVTGNTAANGTHTLTATGDPVTFTLDGTTGNGAYTGGGTSEHFGTNQIGRYAIHCHHLFGPVSTPANGYQFTLIGNVIDDPLPTHVASGTYGMPASKWGLAIHGSSYGRIYRNIIHHYAGANFAAEDGSESYNEWEENLSVNCVGNVDERQRDGRSGSGFYWQGYKHTILNNVSAGNVGKSVGIVSGTGYFFNASETNSQNRVPLYKGADTHDGAEGVEYELVITNQQIIEQFEGNLAYGMMATGLTIWHNFPPVTPTIIKDFTVWNAYEEAWFGYPISNLIFDGYVVRGCGVAWTNGDYMTSGTVIIRNADVVGAFAGFSGTINNHGVIIVEDSFFKCSVVNLSVQPPATPGTQNGSVDHSFEFNNIVSEQFGSLPGFYHLQMNYSLQYATTNLRVTQEVTVTDWQGVAGDGFRVYYFEQASDFEMPQTGGNVSVGCPEAGLTNAQAYVKYHSDGTLKDPVGSLSDLEGCCIAGAIAPAGATTRAAIDGLLAELGGEPIIQPVVNTGSYVIARRGR